MIVTRSWLNEWVDLNEISTDTLAKTLNSIGLEVDKIHSFSIPDGVVFGRVLECVKHENASKLSVCQVDVGSGVNLQIVCGAANVRAGLDVAVATNGTTMPNGMKIKPVVLRGVESNGMICSASELGLANVNDGIIELDDSIGSYKLGASVNANKILCDDLIEIELTANRGDCLNIRGVARDLSAALEKSLLQINYKESDEKRVGIGRVLHLHNDGKLNVNLKYKAFEPLEFKLPLLIKLRLAQIEAKKSNDIDMLMSYITHHCGVLLKTYSYDFFDSNGSAKINLLKNSDGFIEIQNDKQKVASIAGVSQLDDSKIKEDDKLIFIETSYIDPELISKNMHGKKLALSDDFYRSSRGSEPDLELGLKIAVQLIEKHSKSIIYGGVIEYVNEIEDRIINFRKCDIDKIIGQSIDKLHINKILKHLGFTTEKSTGDNFVAVVPKHRHDILNTQDISEEILRILKIDNIPSKPIAFVEQNRLNDDYVEYKKRSAYRHKAAQSGFFESVHFAFDERKMLSKYGFDTIDKNLELLNPIVNTLDTLRTTLLLSLLRSASFNAKNSYSSIKLFEIGSVFNKKREESLRFSLIMSGERERDGLLNSGKPAMVDFGFFVQKLSNIMGSFKLVESKPLHALAHPFICANIVVDGKSVGEVFRLHPSIEEEFDLRDTFLCEIDFTALPYELKKAQEISRFQPSFRDLSIIIPKNMKYESIKEVIDNIAHSDIKRYYAVDRYSDEKLGESVSLTLRFMLQSATKTFEDDDINAIMDSILEQLDKKLGVGLR